MDFTFLFLSTLSVNTLSTWCGFPFFFPFVMEKYEKTCLNTKQFISTSKQHVEHPFVGQNTQQTVAYNLGFIHNERDKESIGRYIVGS